MKKNTLRPVESLIHRLLSREDPLRDHLGLQANSHPLKSFLTSDKEKYKNRYYEYLLQNNLNA